jgi:hypothetical protein
MNNYRDGIKYFMIPYVSIGLLMMMLLPVGKLTGHDIRPAYLEINYLSNTKELYVLWKTSLFGNPNVELQPEISNVSLELDQAQVKTSADAKIYQWHIENLIVPIKGQTLTIVGLNLTSTDVMVKVIMDNEEEVILLKPEANALTIGEEQKRGKAILRYTRLGIEHIMLGLDHLLFVLGLLLLSRTKWQLIKTITSFTVGHSISLALATIGILTIPEKPLSAIIALSIVFLAWELVRSEKGIESLTIRNPWVVSFLFGIIHGIGFAGGLVQLGLPKADIPLALLFFNVGVEIGQLCFILLVLAALISIKRIQFSFPKRVILIPMYTIGIFASYWFLGRFISIF